MSQNCMQKPFDLKLLNLAHQIQSVNISQPTSKDRASLPELLIVGGLGGTTGSALDSRSEDRGFDSH